MIPGFPFIGGLNGDDFFPDSDSDYEEAVDEDCLEDVDDELSGEA